MKKTPGFTLIELIVVIVILGILAAYAVPKYYSLDDEARKSITIALAKNLKSAAYMVHGIASIQGKLGKTDEVDIGKGRKVETYYGYPAPTKEGILSAMQDLSNFEPATGYDDLERPLGFVFFTKGLPFINSLEELEKKLKSPKITDKKEKYLRKLDLDEQFEFFGIKSCGVIYTIHTSYHIDTHSGKTKRDEYVLKVKPLFDGC